MKDRTKEKTRHELYSKNRIIEFWTVMALIVLSTGGYGVYVAYNLYPEYEAVKNDNITLNTLAAWAMFLGVAYFLFSLSFFHLVSAKIKGHIKAPRTDYVVVLVKLIVFFIWIYVSNEIYYDYGNKYDDVEKLISLGIIGGTIFAFDVIYFLVFTFIMSAKGLAFSERRKKKTKHKKGKKNNSHIKNVEISDSSNAITAKTVDNKNGNSIVNSRDEM